MASLRNILSLLFIGLVSFALTMNDAEAKRLGSGQNLGRESPTYSRPASPSAAPQAAPAPSGTRPATPAPARSGASRWLGPLAGLAAGGLLAALLFGDGFQSLQLFDILIIIALGVGIWWFLRTLRGRSSPARSYAGAGPAPVNVYRFQTPEIGSGLGSARPLDTAHLAWFNEESFMKNARTHYLRLQAAWDAGDMEEIREYVTPKLFRELSRERAALGSGPNRTDVVSLDLEFLGLATEGDTVVAGVRYSGYIREEAGGRPEPFRETWHIERSLTDPEANWYVAGIQQG